MGDCHKLGECGLSEDALYVVLKSVTSNYKCSIQKFSQVPKVMGRVIWSMRVATVPGTILWHRA
jgi:hypothetical protein